MPKGYVIVTEAIHDPVGLAAYKEGAVPTFAAAGARPIVVDPKPEVLEGEWHGDQTVILEFDSVEAAQGWYHSPEYQAVIGLRHAAASSNFVIVAGFEPSPE
jgi:uncharacterized protein (DUF1330 family)